jgi:hypothetical protein
MWIVESGSAAAGAAGHALHPFGPEQQWVVCALALLAGLRSK